LLQKNIAVADTLRVSFSGSSDSICPGSSVLITAQAFGGNRFGYHYAWSNGLSGSNQAYFSPKSSTAIQVIARDGCSKPDTATRLLFVHPNTWFNAKSSAPACFGLPGYIKLSMSQPGNYRYTWNTQPRQQGDSMRGLAGSRYLVSVVDANSGCKKDTSMEIPGFRKLNAAFITNPPKGVCLSNINPNMYFLDMSSGGTNGTWYFGDGSSEPYVPGNNPFHIYKTDTNRYRVQLIIRNNGGCADSAIMDICVTDTVLLFVPSAFTPNKNGLNEVFLPTITGAREYQLDIYDRWGAKIFSSNNPNQGWDGTYMGKECPAGCYAYSLHYKGRKTYRQVESGLVQLLR
jgi:gliding motility-associated-like protein